MEGRTIVRPGRGAPPPRRTPQQRFNGGPDNCPARLGTTPHSSSGTGALQWRAGQLSGQALRAARPLGRREKASMEGRTIVRPGTRPPRRRTGRYESFNGGPDNCPARRERSLLSVGERQASMEGRTIVRPGPTPNPSRRVAPRSFNGGPDNCPARRTASPKVRTCRSRFNGGPDNCPARPANVRTPRRCGCRLQWRAGQLSGQARRRPQTHRSAV